MQREILFKAKRIDNGQWCYFGLFEKYPENVINPDTICQYTGLTDKNGNKIFEGDQLRGRYGFTVFGTIQEFAIYVDENPHWFSDQEIIGNIHD